tara:strand:+ start:163 stop:327 length:165 start_codon:yes stop_codon:yes gene_type:complete
MVKLAARPSLVKDNSSANLPVQSAEISWWNSVVPLRVLLPLCLSEDSLAQIKTT